MKIKWVEDNEQKTQEENYLACMESRLGYRLEYNRRRGDHGKTTTRRMSSRSMSSRRAKKRTTMKKRMKTKKKMMSMTKRKKTRTKIRTWRTSRNYSSGFWGFWP